MKIDCHLELILSLYCICMGTFWFLHLPDHQPKTIQPYIQECIIPSIHPSMLLPFVFSSIHPPTQLSVTICYFLSFFTCSVLSFSLSLCLAHFLSLPKPIHDINAPLQWAVSFFPDILPERDNLGRRLYVSCSLASQLWTPHTHDNQNDCHGEKLPRKISIWHTDWKHSSRTCYATVTLVSLRCRSESIVGQKRPVPWLKGQIIKALFHWPLKLSLFAKPPKPG